MAGIEHKDLQYVLTVLFALGIVSKIMNNIKLAIINFPLMMYTEFFNWFKKVK